MSPGNPFGNQADCCLGDPERLGQGLEGFPFLSSRSDLNHVAFSEMGKVVSGPIRPGSVVHSIEGIFRPRTPRQICGTIICPGSVEMSAFRSGRTLSVECGCDEEVDVSGFGTSVFPDCDLQIPVSTEERFKFFRFVAYGVPRPLRDSSGWPSE